MENIHNQLIEIKYIIIEVCTLKRSIINYINTEDYHNFINLLNENSLITKSSNYGCIAADISGFYSKNYFRKYLHILFLTKENIITIINDPCDLYQN
jgi:hypothetical protein